MSSLDTSTGILPAPRVARATRAFHVEIARDFADVEKRWQADFAAGSATPFQNPMWLRKTYEALKTQGCTPLAMTLRSAATGQLAMHVPLVLRRTHNRRTIAFADLVTDFNAPILGPAAPATAEDANVMWHDLRGALPSADHIHFIKMPTLLAGRPNPLALIANTIESFANGNLLEVGDDWNAWRYSLERTTRKELERSWRVFQRHPEAKFRRITDVQEALDVLAIMEAQQLARMQALGSAYHLNDPVISQFYRSAIAAGLAGGSVWLTVLSAGSEIVGALLGVRGPDGLVMVRLTHAGGAWGTSSPGRLVIERTLAHFHSEGVRKFDFSVGNFAYKRRFDAVRQPMRDYSETTSFRGLVAHGRVLAGERLRRYPELRARVRRLLGKPDQREEHKRES